jgi:serine/threonine protein kinase
VNFDAFLREIAKAPSIPLSPRARDPFPLGARVGPYRILRRLGQGGMGVVYLATDTRLGRCVALKALYADRKSARHGERAALLREAQSAATVNHPSVPEVYDVGESEGVPFIAMEYVDGRTLRDLLPANGMERGRAFAIARQLAEALARAHELGLVHRDLKPENVMIAREGTLKILDFGLATPSSLRAPGRDGAPQGGTRPYMAPEQLRHEGIDARADVYGFGVLVHEILTGALPEEGAPSLSRRIPRGLRRIIARAIDRDRGARYADGSELVRALDACERARRRTRSLLHGAPLAFLALAAAAAVVAFVRPLARSSGVKLERITSNSSEVLILSQAISPDGSRLAYAEPRGLFLVDLAREPRTSRAIETAPPLAVSSLSWLPGSDALLVAGRAEREGPDLWRVDPSTGRARPLHLGRIAEAHVSPDGTRLAIADPRRVSLAPIERPSEEEVLAELPRTAMVTSIAWEAGGERLDVAKVELGGQIGRRADIEAIDVSTKRSSRIVADPRLLQEIGAIAFAPVRGGWLYALAPWAPHRERSAILERAASGEGTRTLASIPELVASSFTADDVGRNLSFIRYEDEADVYVGSLASLHGREGRSPALEKISLSDRNERPSSWSIDQRSILTVSDVGGGQGVFRQKLDASFPVLLSRPDEWATWPIVLPSGEGVVYWRLPEGHAGMGKATLVLTGEDGSRRDLFETDPTPLRGNGRPPPGTWWVRCGGSTASCLIGHLEGETLHLEALDPLRGRGTTVAHVSRARMADTGFALSRDGARIAFAELDGAAIAIHARSGVFERRLTIPGCALQFADFLEDGSGLVATGICAEEGSLHAYRAYRLPLEGEPEVLWTTAHGWMTHPVVSRDGSAVALSILAFKSAVWLAVTNR